MEWTRCNKCNLYYGGRVVADACVFAWSDLHDRPRFGVNGSVSVKDTSWCFMSFAAGGSGLLQCTTWFRPAITVCKAGTVHFSLWTPKCKC